METVILGNRKTLYLTLKEVEYLRMGSGKDFTMSNFIVCTVHQIQFGRLNLEH